jgi:hypothetical protein
VAIENPRGWRIAKEKASKKIDAIVALAMACCAAMAHRRENGSRAARGFNRAQHVAKERLVADRGLVFIGQTFIDCPATVITQEDRGGAIRVLAAFASEDMSLRRHIGAKVKPWLLANTRALQDRRLLMRTYEDAADRQVQYDMHQTLEDILGGEWEPAVSPWESRRDAMLDVLGKAIP